MPGMYGIVSNDIEQRARFCEINQAYSPYNYEVKESPHCRIAAHAFQGEGVVEYAQKVIAVDGDYSIYRLLSTCPESLYDFKGQNLVLSSRCTGSICIFDMKRGTLYLAADLLNSFPLYYSANKNAFIFSSRIKPLGKFLNAAKDNTGIFEYLLNGYNIDVRTFYDGVYRVRAGELIKVNINTLEYDVMSLSKLWTSTTRVQSIEQLVEKASQLLKKSFPVNASTMLMMSAGWDSRTILAAGLLSDHVENLTAYTHGDLSSREVNIVDRMCEDNKIKLIKQPICSEMFAAEVLQKNLNYAENVVFPYWHWAGERAKEHDFKAIAAGVYGEALGGHYGPPWARKRCKKNAQCR